MKRRACMKMGSHEPLHVCGDKLAVAAQATEAELC